MSIKQINPRNTVLAIFLLAAALIRIVFAAEASMSPVATFTQLGAVALFSGVYFKDKVKAFLFPVAILWISDIFLNRYVYFHDGQWRFFYSGFYWTYISYFLMAMAGKWLIDKVTPAKILLASIVATGIHWIGTSPGCFMIENSIYPQNLNGYFTSLIAAIPYERNFLLGTLVYSALFFGLFEWLQKKYPGLQYKAQPANTKY